MLMKRLVNLVQLAIVAAMLYPVYYIWDTDRIDNFCDLVKPGMSLTELEALAEENHIDVNIPDEAAKEKGQWMTSVESKAALDRYACVILGAADRIATAEIVETE